MYSCKLCNFTTQNRFSLAVHYRYEHPGTKVRVETKVKPSELVTPEQVADALLRKVVNWCTEKEVYVEQLKALKELRNRVPRLEEELRSVRDERDRLLRMHNVSVMSRKPFVSTEELKKLAGTTGGEATCQQ
jgi:hypothetical protein